MAYVPSMGAVRGDMNVNIRVLGDKEAAEAIRNMSPAARRSMLEEFERQAWLIIKDSQERFVPVLSGDLYFSGNVIAHQGRYPTVEFGFGGKAAAYSIVQHETEWFEHPAGGEAKFLLKAFKAAEQRVKEGVSEKIRYELRKFDTRRFS
jgi:hypothetical protein